MYISIISIKINKIKNNRIDGYGPAFRIPVRADQNDLVVLLV